MSRKEPTPCPGGAVKPAPPPPPPRTSRDAMSRPVTVQELRRVLEAAVRAEKAEAVGGTPLEVALAALPAEPADGCEKCGFVRRADESLPAQQEPPSVQQDSAVRDRDFLMAEQHDSAVPELPPIPKLWPACGFDGHEMVAKSTDYDRLRVAAESLRERLANALAERRIAIASAQQAEAERDALRAQIAAAEQRGRAAAFEEVAADCDSWVGGRGDAAVASAVHGAVAAWCRERTLRGFLERRAGLTGERRRRNRAAGGGVMSDIGPLESAAIEAAEWLRQVAAHDPACAIEASDDEDAPCDCGLDDVLMGLEKALGE